MNFFFKKLCFQFSMVFERRFLQHCRNFSTKLSKMNFTCPEIHFDKNIKLTLRNDFRVWARKCLISGRKFAAMLSNLLFCLQMANWKNCFERIFTFFLTFFGLPAIISYFFRCIIPGMVVQTEFHQPRGTYPLLKIFVRKLFVLSGLWAQFLNIHWSLLGMLSKLQFTCS